MSKGKIFTNCLVSIWAMMLVVSFASCSADSEDIVNNEVAPVAEVPFSVILKAYSNNADITAKGDVDNTTLFVFDEHNDFLKQMTVDRTYLLQAKPIQISCPGSDRITVIAWAGLSAENEEISSLNRANIISDLQIRLKQNNGVANSLPGDLFYGQVTVKHATKATAQELKIERKVSSLALVAKGALKVYDSKEGTYFFKVKNTKSSFNHNGELTGSVVEYIVPASLDEKGNLVASTISILPSDNVAIELYKDNKMILSSENAQNSEKASVNEGEQTNIVFDLSRNNYSIVVSDWGTTVQYVTVG